MNPAAIAAEWDPRLVDALKKTDRIRDERGLWGESKAYDVLFSSLVKGPLVEVEKLYKALGLPLSEETEKNMTRFLDSNPKVSSLDFVVFGFDEIYFVAVTFLDKLRIRI